MLPTPFLLPTDQRQKQSLTQDVIQFLNTIIFILFLRQENMVTLTYTTFGIKH